MPTPALPSYVRPIMGNTTDTPMPDVDRVEMDRGPAQQRLINPHLLMNMALSLLFNTQDDVNDFMGVWYPTTIGVIGWFTMTHPRTGQQITARFPSGKLGDVTPITNRYAIASVQTTIEYYNA